MDQEIGQIVVILVEVIVKSWYEVPERVQIEKHKGPRTNFGEWNHSQMERKEANFSEVGSKGI